MKKGNFTIYRIPGNWYRKDDTRQTTREEYRAMLPCDREDLRYYLSSTPSVTEIRKDRRFIVDVYGPCGKLP